MLCLELVLEFNKSINSFFSTQVTFNEVDGALILQFNKKKANSFHSIWTSNCFYEYSTNFVNAVTISDFFALIEEISLKIKFNFRVFQISFKKVCKKRAHQLGINYYVNFWGGGA